MLATTIIMQGDSVALQLFKCNLFMPGILIATKLLNIPTMQWHATYVVNSSNDQAQGTKALDMSIWQAAANICI